MQAMEKFAVVFVHLGDNPSPTLIPFAEYALKNNPDTEIILITDSMSRWRNFPGRLVMAEKNTKKTIKHLVRKAGYKKKIAGGYWVKTYERLFALSNLDGKIDPDLHIIHLESDVLLQDAYILRNALNIQIDNEIAVPRISQDLGIASILYSRNIKRLLEGLNKLDELGKNYPEICTNDMKLLGLALNKNLISELPTWIDPKLNRSFGKQKYLFDGSAIGQYLFGQDPIHSNNIRVGGFENPTFPVKLSTLSWYLDQNAMVATDGESTFYFANLHIHSKEIVDHPINNMARWVQVVQEANGVKSRISSGLVKEDIHVHGYSLFIKIEIYLRTKFQRKKAE